MGGDACGGLLRLTLNWGNNPEAMANPGSSYAQTSTGHSMPLEIHANIISWHGMHEAAAAIAEALDGAVDHLSVIYSNAENHPETGAGDWYQVPQEWFFGLKFRKALDINPANAVMLQINADGRYHDWPALVQRLRLALERDPQIGMWAPDLDVTPWPTKLVATGRARADDLTEVYQTDGVVWALTPPVLERLAQLDYAENNLGWNIDWASVTFCALKGLAVVRDTALCIEHPTSKGYSSAVALQHAKNFFLQLTEVEQAWISQSVSDLRALRQRQASDSVSQGAQPTRLHKIEYKTLKGTTFMTNVIANSEILLAALFDGAVYLGAGRLLDGQDITVDANETQYGFDRVAGIPFPTHLPLPIEVTGDADGWPVQKDGLGEWQVEGWTTLRVGVDHHNSGVAIPLETDLTFHPQGHPFHVDARLAVHRGMGQLVVSLRNKSGRILREEAVPFDPSYSGGMDEEAYQTVSVSFAGVSEPVSVALSLLSERATEQAEPAAFFIAKPVVILDEKDDSIPVAQLFRLGNGEPSHWFKATVETVDRAFGQGLSLVMGDARAELLPRVPLTLQHTAGWGSTQEFSSSVHMRVSVYVDGQFGFVWTMNAGSNILRLPPRYLNGDCHKIELRDQAGFCVLWQDWVLLPRQLTPLDHLQRESRAPLPTDLFPQSPYRFKSLRAHAAAGADAALSRQLASALTALEAGYDTLKLQPLAFPEVENPDVSVVIPAHNKAKVTYACMCALLLAYNKASFEVILVDDGSSDETAAFETIVSGITVVRNTESQKFIRACNAGADLARGKYVVLLNNDTEPTMGWLDELIEAFERFDSVGLVGSKLLYPDGRLQEAGGVIWNTGDPWNYGRLQNPAEPRFNYARQVDYVSGAAMMTTKEIWDEVGGLSAYLEPMYFEDTDFAFKVREAGYTTWFVPSSVVYHYEGITSGTDTASGFKRFQEVNRPNFKRRWAQACAGFSPVGHKPDLEKDRGIVGRVLFVDYTTPMGDRDAGSYAVLQEIRIMQSLGYKVTFMPENLAHMGSYTTELEKQGVEVIAAPFYTSTRQFLEDRASEFDVFYIVRYHVVNNVVRTIRELVPTAKIIMNTCDLHYLRYLRRGISQKSEEGLEESRKVRDEEFEAMRSVDVVLCYNETEIAIVEAASEGKIKVQKCPWVLDIPAETPAGRDTRKGLSFLGSFQHHPNVEGLEWFANTVMSELAISRPDILLSVYGSRMNDQIKGLASSNIDTVGFVENVNDAYDSHRVFVAPLLSGAGLKGKVLSALAHGIPCIISPIAAESTGLRDTIDCFIAETPTEWVEKIIRLYDDPTIWERFRQNGLDLARERFSFEKGRSQMRAAYEAVDLFRSRP